MDGTYWPAPCLPFTERRRLYLEFCAAQAPGGHTGFFSQIARLELGSAAVAEAPAEEAPAA